MELSKAFTIAKEVAKSPDIDLLQKSALLEVISYAEKVSKRRYMAQEVEKRQIRKEIIASINKCLKEMK